MEENRSGMWIFDNFFGLAIVMFVLLMIAGLLMAVHGDYSDLLPSVLSPYL